MNAPPSAVTVWVTLSLFVQVILVPTVTVRLCGLNAKLAMETLFAPPDGTVVGAGIGALVGAAIGAVVGAGAGALVGVAVGAVVAVGVGAVVGVAVGAVVGVAVGVEVLAVDGGPPHAATRNMRPIIHAESHCFGILAVTDCCTFSLLLCFSIEYIPCLAPLKTLSHASTEPGYGQIALLCFQA